MTKKSISESRAEQVAKEQLSRKPHPPSGLVYDMSKKESKKTNKKK